MSRPSRQTFTVLIALPVVVGLTACGSSGSKPPASANAAATATSATSSTPGAATPASTHTKRAAPPKRHHKAAHHQTTTTTSTTTSTPTTTTTTTTTTKHEAKKKTPAVPTPQPLPTPVVAGSAGGMTATLHGPNHAPTINKLWLYSVLAVDGSHHALSGTVDTEFVLGTTVVGHETPPTHPLKNGRLDDTVTFPAPSLGIALTFRVVVHTKLGSVTLDWPVKTKKR